MKKKVIVAGMTKQMQRQLRVAVNRALATRLNPLVLELRDLRSQVAYLTAQREVQIPSALVRNQRSLRDLQFLDAAGVK